MADECRSCGAEVRFVPSAKSGKPMILDAKPEKRIRVFQRHGVAVVGYSGDEMLAEPETVAEVIDTYSSHFASCPKADEWKGRRR